MRGENLLDGVLDLRIAVRAALTFDFLSKLIGCLKVLGIDFYRLTKMFDRGTGVSTLALEESLEIFNTVVLRGEISRFFEALGCRIIVALAQCQHAPVPPAGRLCRHEPGELG